MPTPQPSYALEPDSGTFVIDDYNWAKPLSGFLPGIAGLWGIPLWAYYVNRGQALCSAGVRDKNGQILEFQSFNLAVARTPREGFRTFLRLDGGSVYEPFRKTRERGVRQSLRVGAAEITLHEHNRRLGLEAEVTYFTLPNAPMAALVRTVTLKNGGRKRREVEWLDGVPRLLPYGLDQQRIKMVARHSEAMMGVADWKGLPIFRLKQSAADTESVELIKGGNVYISPGAKVGKGLVVDPAAIFGEAQQCDVPWVFADGGAAAVRKSVQSREGRTPCAFVLRTDTLGPGDEVVLHSAMGYVRRDEDAAALANLLRRKKAVAAKRAENRALIDAIGQHAFTVSAEPAFDLYAQQDFLDNVVRGGMPLRFDTAHGPSAFYVYSRQNGDLERDYHHFVLEPTYLSQGTGHYRSMLQNRRTDTWFFPDIDVTNLVTFLSLVQLDGYNPLEVRGVTYHTVDTARCEAFLAAHTSDAGAKESIAAWMQQAFTPGELVMRLEAARGRPLVDREAAVREALRFSEMGEVGGLHEGFWADHWHYNIDLLDVFAMVYPDRLQEILLEEPIYTFFDDPDCVLPRAERAVDMGGRIRSYGAVSRDAEKVRRIAARREHPYTVRTRHGDGAVYRTTLLVKLLCIITNRLATLDPAGLGMEMEAGKPGWNDSMNGLPGLFGSGLSETLELHRAVRFVLELLTAPPASASAAQQPGERPAASDASPVAIYDELAAFMRALAPLMRRRAEEPGELRAVAYWQQANAFKERYRKATRLGVDGAEAQLPLTEITAFLRAGKAMLDALFAPPLRTQVQTAAGLPYTYFVNDVVRSRPTGAIHANGKPLVEPLEFATRPVPPFLEGPVHWMKDRPQDAAAIYRAVRKSPLFDRKLKMYRACASLQGESYELGRAVGAYPRGWIENESIYLHMEYKYLLEVLRSGLCAEFWRDARTALVPFLDPAVYGRSPLEGASFIVSSAYGDPRLHGQAFQPRLSGITCEFLHIWIIAMAGLRPFRLAADGSLELALAPRLPEWLFTERPTGRRHHDPVDGWDEVQVAKDSLAFELLGRSLVVYHNPRRRPTFGSRGVAPLAYSLTYRDGRRIEVDTPAIPAPHAEAVRSGAVRRIAVELG